LNFQILTELGFVTGYFSCPWWPSQKSIHRFPSSQTKTTQINLRMKNAVFWDVALCRSCVNRRSFEISGRIRSTRLHNPEDGILHSHCHENLKSYKPKNIFEKLPWN
jgi:hypothetical protein